MNMGTELSLFIQLCRNWNPGLFQYHADTVTSRLSFLSIQDNEELFNAIDQKGHSLTGSRLVLEYLAEFSFGKSARVKFLNSSRWF